MSDETLIETLRGIVGKGHVLTNDLRTLLYRCVISSGDGEVRAVARSGAVAKNAAETVNYSGSSDRDWLEALCRGGDQIDSICPGIGMISRGLNQDAEVFG